ncbi:long-chain fatty acid--CoA ligase [Pseudonocardia aurantiaca]|uniref:AMP-binding protein n=1 Tax=Pseudonocardia aurantiaca TaxID=75290 RepID=A0ABW4FLF6_9PSEU
MADAAKDWVRTNAGRYGDDLALENAETGERHTWRQLDQRAGALAGHLRDRYGVGVGDRVLLLAEGDTRTFEVQFACMRLGAILVPLNWRLAVPELVELAADVEPAVAILDGVWHDTGLKIAEATGVRHLLGWRCPGDSQDVEDYEAAIATATPAEPRTDLSVELPTHILHTSGTTGRPKGAITTVKTLSWHALNLAGRVNGGPGTKLLNPMPLFHAGGLTTIATPVLMTGGAVTTMRRFEPDRVLAVLGDPTQGVTHFTAPPIMWASLSALPGFADADFSTLRLAEVAGGVPPLPLLERWRSRGVVLQQAYGGTELGPAVTGMPRDAVADRPSSCGRAVPFTHVRLVTADGTDAATGEVGEVWLKGPSVTPGYWRKNGPVEPARTEDGWFRTGDAARRDADGFYYLVDRVKDMYKSGGENVAPAEVERVLITHPDVLDVAVVGIPDPTWGEVGRAFVVVRPGTTVTLDGLREFCRERIAGYKAPRSLVVVEDLPRNSTGKVSKAALRSHPADG